MTDTNTVILQDKSPFTKILAGAAVGFVIGFLIFGRSGCKGGSTPSLAVSDSVKSIIAAKDKSLKKYQDSLKGLNRDIEYSNSVTEEATTMFNQASDDASNMRDKLAVTQKELGRYKAAKDTAGQLTACDSLNNQVTIERTKANVADATCKTAIKGLQDLSKRKDEALALQGREVAKLRASFDLLGNTLQLVPKAEKQPWVKGYLGVAAGYGTTFVNFGPELTFITRKGFLFGGGGKFGKDGTYGEVRIGKLITFKKN